MAEKPFLGNLYEDLFQELYAFVSYVQLYCSLHVCVLLHHILFVGLAIKWHEAHYEQSKLL